MWQVINGNNVDVLRSYPDNTFDSIVTDPPYGIDFLGKAWDANTGALETYQQCLRVLKPGGHILAFSAPRTYHHLAVTLEQAGFEIRDQIMWIYSSGFPKSQDVGKSIQRSLGVKQTKKNPKASKSTFNNVLSEAQDKQRDNTSQDCKPGTAEQIVCTDPEAKIWEGWGTQLKPAHEPICLARKPLSERNIRDNCERWGVGAINIDATRVPIEGEDTRNGGSDGWNRVEFGQAEPDKYDGTDYEPNELGRFPANVIGEIEEPYQKYFYCPKVNRKERSIGCEDLPQQHIPTTSGSHGGPNGTWYCGDCGKQIIKHVNHSKCDNTKQKVWRSSKPQGNNHPTVKPIELMKYLIKLVTPAGGHVLDPFNGSGSTGCAAVELGMDYTGIELDENYCAIAQRRIEAWEQQHKSGTTFEELFE